MSDRKLLFIRANNTKFGGAEVYLSRLSKALRAQKINHEVVNSSFFNFLPSWLRVLLFNFQVCFTKRKKFYFSLDRISCPDIYRAGDGVHKVFLTVEKKSKTNILHPVYLFLEKRCFHNASCIIANSKMIKQQIIDTYGINSEKIQVIYNGIEHTNLSFNSSFYKLSKEFGIKKNQKIVLYVGSGFMRKGVREFLEIFSKLDNPDTVAFIIGKEKKINIYKNLSIELNINNRVFFTGPRFDVDDFYNIADIFLFPTHYEPFSNVILEAMSFNNVVFTTRQNGASEILDSYYVMKDSKDLAVVPKINSILESNDRLKNIKKENKVLSESFSIDRNLHQTLKVINRLITKR